MRLELRTSRLEEMFECMDDDADHVSLLDKIRGLIEELDFHEGVSLTMVSIPESQDDVEDLGDMPDADPVE